MCELFFYVLTAVLKIQVLWKMMSCQLVKSSVCFEGTGYLHLQDLSSPITVAVPEKYACNSKQCIHLQNANIPFTESHYMNHNIREVKVTKYHLNMNREASS
jgi:hypothetical protein